MLRNLETVKTALCQNGIGPRKVKMAYSPFTNDTSCINNSVYYMYAYHTHMVIMHAYKVQICHVSCSKTTDKT